MKIKSPCKSTCLIDLSYTYCQECLRTINEIENWMIYTEDERQAILKELKERRKETKTNVLP
jgi:predicted Fe-S protein YdhL (DUF1289 family)